MCEQVEKVKEFVEDGKKMMADMEHVIYSDLETLRKEWGEFRDELSDNIHLNVDDILEELRNELRSKVDEDIKASSEEFNKDVKSVADQLHETYLSIQETAKEAKTTANKAHETYLAIQETAKEAKAMAEKAHETYLIFQKDQNKRRMIRGEDVEGFCELREEVRRMSVEAEIAA